MRNAGTVAVATTLLVAGFTPAQQPSEAAADAALQATPVPLVTETAVVSTPALAEPRYEIHSDSPEVTEMAAWAHDRYLQAGLVLPPVDLYFHDDRANCGGNAGRAITEPAGYHLDICSTTATTLTEKLTLHELAHAWIYHNLTAERRQAFMELRKVTAWNDPTVDWWERGTEHAADIIAWGLQETSRRPRLLTDNDLESLTYAFEWLTGTQPLCDTSNEWQPDRSAADSPRSTQNQSATPSSATISTRPRPDLLQP